MASSPDISIVVPAFREAENLAPLTELIAQHAAAAGLSWELIIANDESGDRTEAVCSELASKHPIRLLKRTGRRDLAAAVIDGAQLAQGEFIVVMDADMSHPPSAIAEMVRMLRDDEADMVVGSRNIAGSATDERWSLLRHLNTFVATALARPLTPVCDPMAGFFALKRKDWPAADSIDPIGYKIGLEIMVRCRFARSRIREVPIFFADRKHGKSKMGLREQISYLRHLHRLYRFRWPRLIEFLFFGAVGASGMIVDIAFYLLLVALGAHHEVARAVSFWPATLSNWLLNRVVTFRYRIRRPRIPQALMYCAITLAGFAVNWGTYALLTRNIEFFDEYKLLALVVGVVAGMFFNYIGSSKIAFRR